MSEQRNFPASITNVMSSHTFWKKPNKQTMSRMDFPPSFGLKEHVSDKNVAKQLRDTTSRLTEATEEIRT